MVLTIYSFLLRGPMVLTPQGDVQQAAVLETILLLLVCYPTILWGNIIHLSYPPVVRIDHSFNLSSFG